MLKLSDDIISLGKYYEQQTDLFSQEREIVSKLQQTVELHSQEIISKESFSETVSHLHQEIDELRGLCESVDSHLESSRFTLPDNVKRVCFLKKLQLPSITVPCCPSERHETA